MIRHPCLPIRLSHGVERSSAAAAHGAVATADCVQEYIYKRIPLYT